MVPCFIPPRDASGTTAAPANAAGWRLARSLRPATATTCRQSPFVRSAARNELRRGARGWTVQGGRRELPTGTLERAEMMWIAACLLLAAVKADDLDLDGQARLQE